MADKVITINTPPAANYGRTPGGFARARDEWWSQQGQNDEAQDATTQGATWAQQQSQAQRGPQATENAALANREASGAGGHQAGAADLARRMAMGQSPSEAAYQLQRGLDLSSSMQGALGRSARGAGALATASANQQANTANLQQNAFSQGQALRAQEMATGRGLYGSLLGKQREQDAARLGMGNEMAQANAQYNDRYGVGMGNAAIALGQVGNQQAAQDFGYYQQGMNPVNAQTEAWQQYKAWLANAQKQKQAANIEELG